MSYSIIGSPTPAFDPSGTATTVADATGMPALAVGDYVVVAVAYRAATDVTHTVTDSLGNTYTEDTTGHFFMSSVNNQGGRFFISNITNAGTPSYVRATAASACTVFGCFPVVLRGLTSSAYQVASAYKFTPGATASVDSLASNPVSVTAPAAAVLGFAFNCVGTNGTWLNPGTGETYLEQGQKVDALADIVKIVHKRTTLVGSIQSTFTPTQGGDDFVACTIVLSELNTAPLITGLSVASPNHLGSLTITGLLFGSSSTGSASVTIGGIAQTTDSWAAGSIHIPSVNRGTNLYGVAVDIVVTTSAGVVSEALHGTTLLPQTGWQYQNIITPNSTVFNRLAASPVDLSASMQIAAGNIVGSGNLILKPSGSGGYIADKTVQKFDFEVGVSGSGWGSTATVTLVNPGTGVSSLVASFFGAEASAFVTVFGQALTGVSRIF